LLTDTYVNNRRVNFTVKYFDISNGIPSDYDAVVFVDYAGYSNPSVKSNITDYLNKGRVIIGINATININDADFNEIFGLTSSTGTSSLLNFTYYNPNWDNIAKYFLGFGFDVNTPSGTGTWYIWEDNREVNVSISGVDIENKTVDEGFIQDIPEGGTFKLKTDSLWHTFKIKKIWSIDRVDIQPLNKSFVFKDFSEKNVKSIELKNILSNSENTYAGLTTNNTAIWISDFTWSDEYRTLVKAIIASKVTEWFATGKEEISWWDLNWQYRRKLTFDNSAQNEGLDEFPVLVKLDSSFDYSNTKPDGTDLRFIDSDDTIVVKKVSYGLRFLIFQPILTQIIYGCIITILMLQMLRMNLTLMIQILLVYGILMNLLEQLFMILLNIATMEFFMEKLFMMEHLETALLEQNLHGNLELIVDMEVA